MSLTRSVAGSRSVTHAAADIEPWMLAALEAWPCACACGIPITLGRWGGGSLTWALRVRDDRGTAEAGVEVSKSVYEMKESLFDGFFGDGGACDANVALVVGVAAPIDTGPARA